MSNKDVVTSEYSLLFGDCLERMKEIPDASVDMILTDPPYGTTVCKWDSVIPFEPMWEQLKRIIKPKGAIVITASQPFTSVLVCSNLEMFKHEWIYQKAAGTNFATVKYQPMKEHESVVVFSKGVVNYYPIKEQRRGKEIGKVRKKSRDVSLMTEYESGVYGVIPKDRDSREYGELRNPSSVQLFNNRNPSDRGSHPTQKPIALMEYLIKTYSKEGETVLDFTFGSCSTGVACLNTNRRFIGVEMDEKYFNIGVNRMQESTIKGEMK